MKEIWQASNSCYFNRSTYSWSFVGQIQRGHQCARLSCRPVSSPKHIRSIYQFILICVVWKRQKTKKRPGLVHLKKNNVPTKHRPRKTWPCCSGWSHGIRDVVNGGSRPEINLLFRSRDIQFKWIESVLEKEEREKMGKLLLLWLCNRKIWS